MSAQQIDSVQKAATEEKTVNTYELALNAARHLAGAVADSEEFQEYSSAVIAFKADRDAQELFREYQKAQRVLEMAGQLDQDVISAITKAEELKAELDRNEVLTRFFSSQQSLVSMLQQIDQDLREKTGFSFAQFGKCSGGCC